MNARSYFGARYYRAQIGRFTTIDPVYTWKENLEDPQRWNRYAYVRNNPLKFVDPDGRAPWLPGEHAEIAERATWSLSRADTNIIVKASVEVDRLSNAFNNAAHYMPGHEAEAEAIIAERRETAVRLELTGRHREAMEALGEGIHTVADKRAHAEHGFGWMSHISKYLGLGHRPDNTNWHSVDRSQSQQDADEYVDSYERLLAKRKAEQEEKRRKVQ